MTDAALWAGVCWATAPMQRQVTDLTAELRAHETTEGSLSIPGSPPSSGEAASYAASSRPIALAPGADATRVAGERLVRPERGSPGVGFSSRQLGAGAAPAGTALFDVQCWGVFRPANAERGPRQGSAVSVASSADGHVLHAPIQQQDPTHVPVPR